MRREECMAWIGSEKPLASCGKEAAKALADGMEHCVRAGMDGMQRSVREGMDGMQRSVREGMDGIQRSIKEVMDGLRAITFMLASVAVIWLLAHHYIVSRQPSHESHDSL